MADPGMQTVEFEGTTHQFPADFSQQDIQKALAQTHGAPSARFMPPAQQPPAVPPPPDSGPSYVGEAIRGLGRGVAGLVTAPIEAMKPRTPDEVQYGPVGRLLLHTGQDFLSGLERGKQAREAARASGEGVAGQTLATLEQYPIVGGMVRQAEKGGPQYFSPQSVGAAAEALPQAMTFMLGKKVGSAPSDVSQVEKLSAATGAAPRDLSAVQPELQETVKASGKTPRTVGDVADAIQQTSSRLEQKFNHAMSQVGHQQVVPTEIADALEAKARTMPPSPEGQAAAQQLRDAAVTYQQPWTLQQLNAERMFRNGMLKGFYNKSGSGQMAAMRSNVDTMIDQTVADATKDVLYDQMQRRLPHAGVDFQDLKLKQSHMMDIMDDLESRLDALDRAHAEKAGAPLRAKLHPSLGVHPGGVSSYMHAGKLLPGGDPLANANISARTAFGPTPGAVVRGAAIRALPASSLISGQAPVIPPPPAQSQQQ